MPLEILALKISMIQSVSWLILNNGGGKLSIPNQKLSEYSCYIKYCHHSGVASLTASGSYHLGPNPAAFLASSLKGGFNGPLKCVLTIE